MVAEMTLRPRSVAKILNLAMTYGKGKRSLADELGVSLQEAEGILKDYHNRLPFIKSLEDKCKIAAGSRGYIKLIDGARIHYPMWEGGYIEWEERLDAERRGKKLTPTTLDEARLRAKDPDHPWSKTRLRRADTRKSLNNLVQGSAARQTKRAMEVCWQEGIIPLIQMHDELGISTADKKVAERVRDIMVETTPLVVPTIVDFEVGLTWGEAKEEWV
jgi:DNA polymerase I-like protein with 3'-5' exonuclease and polymerase domains